MRAAGSYAWSASVLAACLASCAADQPGARGASAGSAAPGATAGAGSGGNGFGNASAGRQAVAGSAPVAASGGSGAAACVQEQARADFTIKPVDVIFLIDTSASMVKEIEGVQNNINQNFAQIIGASGIDYRLIMIADHEGLLIVCITGQLNPSGACGGADNPPSFYHYALKLGSNDPWCKLLSSYRATDEAGQSPGGWSQWLRPEAHKVFVQVTDDNASCVPYLDNNAASPSDDEANANSFDAALLALDPAQFGTSASRNYTWHSLVGVRQNSPATNAYLPSDPMVSGICETAVNEGHGYQALSRLSGGLRFPVCEGFNFDVVFRQIAEGVVRGSIVKCEFPIPEPPTEQQRIDLDTVEIAYTPGDGSPVDKLREAQMQATCDASSFYVDGSTIRLCPAACDRVQADASAQLDVLWGCELPPPE